MTAAEITELAGVVVSLLAAVIVPIYLVRRGDAKVALERLETARLAALAGSAVSWEAINKAIVKERDELRKELKEATARHTAQLTEMRLQLNQEADEQKKRHDYELARANERIGQLSEEVDRLYRRLYQQGDAPRSPAAGVE